VRASRTGSCKGSILEAEWLRRVAQVEAVLTQLGDTAEAPYGIHSIMKHANATEGQWLRPSQVLSRFSVAALVVIGSLSGVSPEEGMRCLNGDCVLVLSALSTQKEVEDNNAATHNSTYAPGPTPGTRHHNHRSLHVVHPCGGMLKVAEWSACAGVSSAGRASERAWWGDAACVHGAG
jgi:hypothetical protein